MNVCRICLSSSAEKDLCHLNGVNEDDVKSYKEILFFCLDIQVTKDSKITRKLCMKCYRNILSFYKFKSLALKNDAYLKNLANCVVKLVQLVSEHAEEEKANYPLEDCNEINFDSSIVKEEPEIKEEKVEIEVPAYQSDEEPLSVIKEIKYEMNDNVTNGNVTNDNLTNGETKGKAPKPEQDHQKSIKANSNKSGVCEECGQSVRNLKQHALIHIPLKDRKRFKCKECDRIFNNDKNLSKHFRTQHLGIKKHCDICNKAPKPEQDHQKSIKANSNKSGVCEECGQSVRNLKQHALIHIPLKDRKRFKCKECDRIFNNDKNLSKHFRTQHLGIKKHCDICNKDYVDLKLHKLIRHNPEKMRYVCAECGRRCAMPSLLKAHMRTHNKEKSYECDVCHMKFRHPDRVIQHRRAVHDNERTFMCQYCSRSFFKKSQLERHISYIHTKEKSYKCLECGKGFSCSTGLNAHKLRHAGLRNYRCKYCDKGFTTGSALHRHHLIHTTEKIHPCRYCGVKFRRTDQQRVHEVTTHEKHIQAAG